MVFIRDAREGITVSARRGTARSHITAALLLVATFVASYTAHAGDLDKAIAFNITAQTLDKALLQFGAQAHVQIMFAWDSSTAKHRTRELKGTRTGKEALAEILKGTRLRFVVQGHTLEILPQALVDPSPSVRASKSLGAQQRNANSLNSNTPMLKSVDPPVTDRHSRSGESTRALAEIIVTAQKYSQRAFDVPISLDVISGQELQQLNITSLSDLQYDVPGLYLDSTGTQHAVYLRGVGNLLGNGAMVGQYIDEADITAETYESGTQGYDTGDNGLYDLNRVEVLKGPQGTLYGDGSMGGVIRYITNKPVLDRYQMSEDIAAVFTEYGAPSQHIETMLNAPLIEGTLGLRLAGIFEHDGGWVDEPAANLKNINGENLADVRVEALWQPAASFKVNATQIVHRNTSGLGSGEDASGNITPLFDTTFMPNLAENSNLSNLTVTYDFDGARLLSSSTYVNGEENIYNNYASETVPLNPTFWYLQPYLHVSNKDSSEELRLARTGRGPWQWSVGGFYKDYREGLSYPGEFFGLAGSSLSAAYAVPGEDARFSSSSWAGFADISCKLLERLTLGAGVRYFKDRETELSVLEIGYLSPDSPRSSVPTPYSPETFDSTDPRFYVQYRVTSHVNTYASASKGFRSGGPNLTPAESPYQPETLWSYDLGTKIRYPKEGVRADVDLFDMNYTKFVSTTYIPPIYEETNVGNARIQGVDADLTWRPVDEWTLNLNTEILRTKFLTASAISGYAPGQRLPFAPQYSFTASVERQFRWTDKLGSIEVYYYEISRVQSRLAGLPVFQSDILHFLNARADIHWNDELTLGLFAHNLLNDRGYESPLYYTGSSVRPRPKTFGVEFAVSFGR